MFNRTYENIINECGNAYSLSRHLYRSIANEAKDIPLDRFCTDFEGCMLDKSVLEDWTPSDDRKGGVIVFSTVVNAVKQSDNVFVDFFKKKLKTFMNSFTAEKKVDRIAKKHDLVGWTIGRFLHGRYTGRNGKIFSENSLSVEIIGVTFDELVQIAEEICIVMDQESVLVKDYSSMKVVFVGN